MSKTKFLNLNMIESVCYKYAKARLTFDEPIPDFNNRFPGKLEGALHVPQQKYESKLIYKTLSEQAAVLFYEMIKVHPFLNGNKRIATVSLMVFLSLNNKWLNVNWKQLYDVAVTVANSNPENRDGVLKLLIEFMQNNIRDYE